ncbi:MAG TPA: beta-ketoacyl-[acyl-carrier-protein] synthase family protein [Tepidisphaeraceae bacterium]|nr:beta-ketoacyl-[acyl-carrier-protein] synthase family protein [Tepidisphaeraceae bacterium]
MTSPSGPTNRARVVITGIGAVSPNGIGAESYAAACAQGRSGLSRLTNFDTTQLKTTSVAQVNHFDPLIAMDAVDVRRVPRMVHLAMAASKEAMESARLEIDVDDIETQRQIGVALGTGGGGLAFVEEQYHQMFRGAQPSLFSITAGTHGNLSSELSIGLHLRGPSHVLSTGCTSSTDAIAYAATFIRQGTVPMMLAGGADAPIAPGILAAFEKMRVISTCRWDDPTKASRPFSKDRDGFVLGEGAWMFILENRDHAIGRGVPILAEIVGYGSTCDAYHRVQIAPQLDEPVRAIELALADANISKDRIDYVNLHGTGTELNDRLETSAMWKCFGGRAGLIPMSSTKSMIGHPQGACGAAGLAATILCMRRNIVHPTINLDEPDPQCDLDYVPHVARKAKVEFALCNCIAFGSKNSALVIRRG